MAFATTLKNKIKNVYENHYKVLLVFTVLLVVLALVQIGTQYALTGDFVQKGVTLKGGSTITILKEISLTTAELESFLTEKYPSEEMSVRTISSAGKVIGTAIDTSIQDKTEINSFINVLNEKVPLMKEEYNVEIMGSALGNSFFKQIVWALFFAFVLMGIVVLLYFRMLIPSAAVIAAGFSDIVVTLAIFNLLGFKLSTAGVAAFLMLVGYSVDTDMLLTTRVLKRKEGTLMEKVYGSIKTGLTMTFTTLMVVIVTLIFVQSDIIKQIMLILFIGLIVDMLMTWVQNVGILRLYLERKKKA